MRKKRPRHTSEFKAEAVSLHHASKQSLQKTALSIGIGKSTLSIGIGKSTLLSWVQQAAIAAGGERPGALTTDERAELIVLRRENRQVKLARDFLKKSALSQPRKFRNASGDDPGGGHDFFDYDDVWVTELLAQRLLRPKKTGLPALGMDKMGFLKG